MIICYTKLGECMQKELRFMFWCFVFVLLLDNRCTSVRYREIETTGGSDLDMISVRCFELQTQILELLLFLENE